MKLHPEPTNYAPDCFVATCDEDGQVYLCFRPTVKVYNNKIKNSNGPWPNWLWPEPPSGGVIRMDIWQLNPGAGYSHIQGKFGSIMVARKLEIIREQVYCIEPDIYSEEEFLRLYTPEKPKNMRGGVSLEFEKPYLQ